MLRAGHPIQAVVRCIIGNVNETMNRKRYLTYWMWVGLMTVITLLLQGCSQDATSPDQQQQGTSMQLSGVTRAGSSDTETVKDAHIRVFLTHGETVTKGLFTYNNQEAWNSTIKVIQGNTYHVYGYMPSDIATTSEVTVSGTVATMTLNGLKAVSDQDVCVLVGIQRVTSSTEEKNVVEGNYTYAAGAEGTNYAYVLMDHLYASLKASFSVNADYAALRQIYLKQVTLTSDDATVNAVITFTDGSGLTGTNVTMTKVTPATEGSATAILPNIDSGKTGTRLLTSAIGSCDVSFYFAPLLFGIDDQVKVKSTYDVYDMKGNLVRSDCTAENKLVFSKIFGSDVTITRGNQYQLKMTVNPTYLYMLSEPDLDNPTVNVE